MGRWGNYLGKVRYDLDLIGVDRQKNNTTLSYGKMQKHVRLTREI